MKVLLLAGTAEARRLAEALVGRSGVEVVASLAGHTSAPVRYPCPVRIGGFGGLDGLTSHLRHEQIDVVVDATHPFSSTMGANAAAAAERCGLPRLRLVRPVWEPVAGDRWTHVDDLDGAARAVVDSGATRALLTVGRLELAAFAGVTGVDLVVRSVEPPDPLPVPAAVVLRERGPFTVDHEEALLRSHGIDLVVTKNSGGDDAKLVACRRAAVPVVVVRRPPSVAGPSASTVDDALRWFDTLLGRR